MRVLILDFDFHTVTGGGQTFYRRVVARHPQVSFLYPSYGPDLRQEVRRTLPPNAEPFPLDIHVEIPALSGLRVSAIEEALTHNLCRMALALQGSVLDVVDVPAYFPAAHLVRPIFARYGIAVGCVAQALLGWGSVTLQNAYGDERSPEIIEAWAQPERRSSAAADVCYALSHSHAAEDSRSGVSPRFVDMHDALEEFDIPSPEAPGSGPPDLWFVGRLDRNKGPDLFLEMVARLPEGLYRRCRLAGPDNVWSNSVRWSEHLMELARQLGIPAKYVGRISNEELRNDIYKGRSVLVVPSRADVFNYVALEAVANGCPILLSRQAGAADFLQENHPHLAPLVVDPEDLAESAAHLEQILRNFNENARRLRRLLSERPLPRPREDFMLEIYRASERRVMKLENIELARRILLNPSPLLSASAAAWRPLRTDGEYAPAMTAVVIVRNDPTDAAATLACLARQTVPGLDAVVMDAGYGSEMVLREVVSRFGSFARMLPRKGIDSSTDGLGRLAIRGTAVSLFAAGDIVAPDFLSRCLNALAQYPAAGICLSPWTETCELGIPRVEHGLRDLSSHSGVVEVSIGPGATIRRAVLEELVGLDDSLGLREPLDLLRRICQFHPVIGLPSSASAAWRRVVSPQDDDSRVALSKGASIMAGSRAASDYGASEAPTAGAAGAL